MDDVSVPQRGASGRRVGRPAFDLVESKLRCPPTRPGTVVRTSLIARLERDGDGPIVSVVAPAGYGKSTLLAQWAESTSTAFAWVSVDEADNDPKVLLSYVAAALDRVHPIGERVFDALASPMSSVPGSVVPRLGAAFWAMAEPVVLVLDDVHLVRNMECRAALSVLADHVPAGSRIVFAGRDEPPLRVARLRAEGRVTEIDAGDLSLSAPETAELLRAADVDLGEGRVAQVHRRTEGWPVAVYLAALSLRGGGSLHRAAARFGGDDRFVSDYVESEFLARISSVERMFLTRTAALERLSGPLCDAVLGVPGSAALLTTLARSNLLMVPLDRRGEWYRYHHLFRDVLQAELQRTEPHLVPVLRRRAAAWCLEHGSPEDAVHYSILAEDVDTVADLLPSLWGPLYRQGRTETLQRWFSWLEDRGGIQGHPLVALDAAFLAETTGHPVQAERWAAAVDRWQHDAEGPVFDAYTEALAATLRAILCRDGAERMRVDADEAAHRFAVANVMVPVTPLLQGIARVLCGDVDGGDAFFADGLSLDEERFSPDIMANTLCQRALVAIARDQWDVADGYAHRAVTRLDQAGTMDSYAAALTNGVRARIAMHRGEVSVARRRLMDALRLRPLLTYVQPHGAVQLRTNLIRVNLALGDVPGARTLMLEIDEIFSRRPDLGTLTEEAIALRAQLRGARATSVPGASTLTPAELRVLPLLSTHLPVPQIAQELFLSPATVKSHIRSIYRKLGASSRSQAVSEARELGLLEG